MAAPLAEFGYGDVDVASEAHESQLMNTHDVLMALSEDSLLKPFRQMSGMSAPGEDLGGWYNYDPNYDYRKGFDEGFAPGCTFGQWVSALARCYAITGEAATREKVLRLNRLYAQTITADFYIKNRFPAYTYDKLLLGLLDSHTYVKDPLALEILEHTTNTALPHLPGHAVEHDHP
ncbi:MAG: beta-L-arabinofuranosidase domain-containing protein, partial [Nevskiales bacterium]